MDNVPISASPKCETCKLSRETWFCNLPQEVLVELERVKQSRIFSHLLTSRSHSSWIHPRERHTRIIGPKRLGVLELRGIQLYVRDRNYLRPLLNAAQ